MRANATIPRLVVAIAVCFGIWIAASLGCSQQKLESVPESKSASELKAVPAQPGLGINLDEAADWNTELPFVDVFRLSRQWISQREGADWGQGPGLERDENGWIKRLAPNCWVDTPMCTIEGGRYPQGQYVCLYEGQGKIELWGISRVISDEPGRIVFETDTEETFYLSVRETDPDDHVRNIRVLMPGFEKTYEKEPFRPAFLERWKGFDTIRFMDWMLTNDSTIGQWEQRPTPAYCNHTERGVPVEVMVDLSNRLKSNPWFCMPHLATDDYVRRFAELVKRTLDPSLRVHVEYSNEIWNGMFEQHHYCGDEGLKLGLHDESWEAAWRYNAHRSVQIFDIWEDVFGGTDRLVRIIASQASEPYVGRQELTFRDSYKKCDALAIAPYVSLNIYPESENNQPDVNTVVGWTLEQLMDHVERECLPESVQWVRDNKKLADEYGLQLIAYEAGQHLVGVDGGEDYEELTQLLHAANRHPRMGEIYTRFLNAWEEAGGSLCCLYSSTGAWSEWGSWGLLEYYDETEDDQPKFRAVMEWNRRHATSREE